MEHKEMSKRMSKVETPNTLTKTYKYFDLDTFETKTETVQVPFTEETEIAVALQKIGNDQEVLLKAINSLLKSEALAKAEQSVIEKGGRKSVVLSVMKPFRSMPPYNGYFLFEADGKTKKLRTRKTRSGETVTEPAMDKARQDKELMEMFKSNPALLNSIKQASLEAVGTEDDDETEESEG